MWKFSDIFLFLISSVIPLLSESRHCIISILANLSVCFSTRMWYVLVDVPCELEEKVSSAVVEISLYSHLHPTDISAH